MFVEVVRLFMVVLFTAAGYWLGRDTGSTAATASGIAAMLGCLVGYVMGGLFGRLLERAVGVVERRVERLPAAQVIAGFVGACIGGLAAPSSRHRSCSSRRPSSRCRRAGSSCGRAATS